MRRFLGVLLPVVMVVSGVTVLAPAAAGLAAESAPLKADAAAASTNSASDVSGAKALAARSDQQVEIAGARDESSSTFANPDGTLTTNYFTEPVHVKQGSQWVDVDTTLVSDSTGVHPKTVQTSTVLSGGGADSDLISSTLGADKAGLGWASRLPAPTLAGSTATYANVLPGTDLVVEVNPDGYEFSLAVKVKPRTNFGSVSVPLHLGGLTASMTDGGNLLVKNAKGAVVLQMVPPVMYDASKDDNGAPHSAPVTWALQGNTLVLTPSPGFLTDPSTVYPVTVDPSASYGRASDTYIQASNPTTNFGASAALLTGSTNGGTDRSRSLVTFDTSNLNGKYVQGANLSLFNYGSGACYTGTSSADPLNVLRITTAWAPSTITWNTGAVGTAATTFQIHPSLQPSNASCPVGIVTTSVTATVQGWASHSYGNYGFLLEANSETNSAGYRNYYSGDHSGGRPGLAVTYDSYPNPPASVTPSAQSYITDPNGQLSAVVSDPDGGTVTTQWYVTDLTTSTVIINNGQSPAVPSGSTATYGLAGQLTSGHQYSLKARACDGTLCSGWTTTTTSTADFTAPNTPSVSSSVYAANAWRPAGGTGTFTLSDTSTDIDHYLYGLDAAAPGTTTSSSLTVSPMADGWHTLTVRAVDHAGLLSPIVSYQFGAGPAITSVNDGDTTAGLVNLTAMAASGYSGLTVKYRRSDTESWTALPTGDVTLGGTPISSWPLTASASTVAGTSPAVADSIGPANLVWNAASTLVGQDSPVQLQVCFGSDCSLNTVHVTVDEQQTGSSFASMNVGPGLLNLYTGDLAVSSQDVSVSTPNSDLSVARTFDTRYPTSPADGMFGPGWTGSLPVQSSSTDWTQLVDTGAAVTLMASDGSSTSFAKTSTGYIPTGDASTSGDTLTAGTAGTYGPTSFVFADLAGNQVTFSPQTSFSAAASLTVPHGYHVTLVTQPGSAQTTTYTYVSGLLTQVLAPIPTGATCTNPAGPSTWTAGCRALTLSYDGNSHVTAVTFVSNPGSSVLSVDMACYSYNTSGQLTQTWDPRNGTAGSGGHPVVCGSPVLATAYTYNTAGRLATITPPGLAAWNLTYDGTGRLITAGRTHNATFGSATETISVDYGISLAPDGSHPEYRADLTAATAATWAQTDTPATATVVYPPGSTVSATDLRDGQVHYMDPNGAEVNTADYASSGASGWHITTTEYDANGNQTRSLSAANREEALSPTSGAGAALELPADTAAAALALSDQSVYTTASDGVDDLTDSYGPYHFVTLSDGTAIAARQHTHDSYDTGSETGHPSGGSLHLVTSQTTGASESMAPVTTNEQDIRRTDTAYALSGTDATGWTFSSPMKVTEDPTVLARTTTTRYDPATGAAIESRMPSNTGGGTAGTTLSIYYVAGTNSQDAACGGQPAWAGLLCETAPSAQPGVTGLPGLVTKRIVSYDYLDRPTQQNDLVTDAGGTPQTRTTTTTYLNSGYDDRTYQVALTGGLGAAVPTSTTSYDPTTGLATTTSAAATADNAATSATTGYDDFGRTVSYVDANEATGAARNATTTSYDPAGRISVVSDAHTTRTYSYNAGGEHRDLPTSMAVTVNSTTPYSGTFTTAYGADGNAALITDPNGISTTTGYDETGQALSQTSVKVSDGSSWLTDTATASIDGQWRSESNNAGSHTYSYDKLGRLTTATDTPNLGTCSTNTYSFDADSNRTAGNNYPAATTDGSCQTATGAVTTSHTYDNADRLQAAGSDTGLAYDAYGRTTTLPAADAGGTTLTNAYYVSDLVRSQTQNSITECWTLDAAARLKQHTTYAGSNCSATLTATTTNHYNDPSSDSPTWIAETADSSQWTANISGASGLALTVAQAGAATYQYANLHGDLIATATSPTTLTIGADYDEYGNPASGQTQRYGWLGATQRSGDALGASVLMGARLYQPSIGRFLTGDPIAGGSANSYDYANQDPLNQDDITGLAANNIISSGIVSLAWYEVGMTLYWQVRWGKPPRTWLSGGYGYYHVSHDEKLVAAGNLSYRTGGNTRYFPHEDHSGWNYLSVSVRFGFFANNGKYITRKRVILELSEWW